MSEKFVVNGGLSIPSGNYLELGGTELSATATELNLLDGMTAISTDTNLGTSDTILSTQNAVKSYVDAQLGASVLTFQTETGSDNTVDLDEDTLTFAGLSGVGVTNDGDAITISMNNLSSFDTGDLSEGSNLYYTDERVDDRVNALITGGDAVSSTYDDDNGTLTLAAQVDNSSIEIASDALQIKASGVTNAMLAGSIANAKLANSSVSFGGVSLALGGTDATPAFDLTDADSYPGDSSLVTTGALSGGSIASTFGNINIGSSTLTAGATTLGGDLNMQGNNITGSADNMLLVAGDDTEYDFSGDDNGTIAIQADADSSGIKMRSKVVVGDDQSGKDVTMHGTVQGANMLWDASADKLHLTKSYIEMDNSARKDFTCDIESAGEDVIVSYPRATFEGAEIVMRSTDGADRTVKKVLVTNTSSAASLVVYGTVNSNSSTGDIIGELAVAINGDNVEVKLAATGATASDGDVIKGTIDLIKA